MLQTEKQLLVCCLSKSPKKSEKSYQSDPVCDVTLGFLTKIMFSGSNLTHLRFQYELPLTFSQPSLIILVSAGARRTWLTICLNEGVFFRARFGGQILFPKIYKRNLLQTSGSRLGVSGRAGAAWVWASRIVSSSSAKRGFLSHKERITSTKTVFSTPFNLPLRTYFVFFNFWLLFRFSCLGSVFSPSYRQIVHFRDF